MRSTILVTLLAVALPTLATARTWHVPGDAPTIQAGIDSAAAGDDVLVAPGTYFEHDLVMKGGITVQSEAGPDVTTVDADGDGRIFDCTDLLESSVIAGFTMLHGQVQGAEEFDNNGGGVRCVGSDLVIHECFIAGCVANDRGGGIFAYESSVQIAGCTVEDCSAFQGGGIVVISFGPSTVRVTDCEALNNETVYTVGGIQVLGQDATIIRCVVAGNIVTWGGVGGIGCRSPMFTIQDCIVIDNQAGVTAGGTSGIYIDDGSAGSISGCTVAHNKRGYPEDPAVFVGGDDADVGIDRTIIAFNEGSALECEYGSEVSVHCCDTYGNTHDDDLCGTDLGGNFSLDPLFCDAENGDYTLDGCSPCLPGNHPHGVDCGLIGALGQGCGATAIEETSWGRIKSLYRR